MNLKLIIDKLGNISSDDDEKFSHLYDIKKSSFD